MPRSTKRREERRKIVDSRITLDKVPGEERAESSDLI